MIDSILLTAARIVTFDNQRSLTNASGFFFERGERLFLVTSRHVLVDAPSRHQPNRIEIELHTREGDLGRSIGFSVPLYRQGKSQWRQGTDSGGEIDIAMIELERDAMPASSVLQAFTPEHLQDSQAPVRVGSSLLVVGFPLGFHDTLHHLRCAGGHRVRLRHALPGPGLLPDRRTHPSRHQRRAGGDARPVVGRTGRCRGSCSVCTRRAWT